MITLTEQQKEAANVLGLTEEQMIEALSQNTLSKGAYKLRLTVGSVKEIERDGDFKGAKEINMGFKVLDSNGDVATRYGTVWGKFVLPAKTGDFAPTATTISIGTRALNWLSSASKMPVTVLAKSFKNDEFPVELVNMNITGFYTERKDPKTGKSYPEIRPVDNQKAKTVTIKPAGKGAAPSASAAAESEVPF